MNTDELILQMLHQLDEKIIRIETKLDEKFNGLACSAQNIRIDRLEQKEAERKDNKAMFWTIAIAAVGAFGLSLWNWIRSL